MGHSFGSLLALSYAVKNNDKMRNFDGLILMGKFSDYYF